MTDFPAGSVFLDFFCAAVEKARPKTIKESSNLNSMFDLSIFNLPLNFFLTSAGLSATVVPSAINPQKNEFIGENAMN
jgi:hypothetical protein